VLDDRKDAGLAQPGGERQPVRGSGVRVRAERAGADRVTGVLRAQLGFSGLVLTDSLSAGAVSAAGYSVPRAAVAALAAGADMVLYTATPASVAGLTQQTVDALVAAVNAGVLPRNRLQDAVQHILNAKHVSLCG
jgi:beta-N-acetylhexosaminidase